MNLLKKALLEDFIKKIYYSVTQPRFSLTQKNALMYVERKPLDRPFLLLIL